MFDYHGKKILKLSIKKNFFFRDGEPFDEGYDAGDPKIHSRVPKNNLCTQCWELCMVRKLPSTGRQLQEKFGKIKGNID